MKLTSLSLLMLAVLMTGCASVYAPVKYSANAVCKATEAEQELLKEKFDEATYPHTVRVHCYSQMRGD